MKGGQLPRRVQVTYLGGKRVATSFGGNGGKVVKNAVRHLLCRYIGAWGGRLSGQREGRRVHSGCSAMDGEGIVG